MEGALSDFRHFSIRLGNCRRLYCERVPALLQDNGPRGRDRNGCCTLLMISVSFLSRSLSLTREKLWRCGVCMCVCTYMRRYVARGGNSAVHHWGYSIPRCIARNSPRAEFFSEHREHFFSNIRTRFLFKFLGVNAAASRESARDIRCQSLYIDGVIVGAPSFSIIRCVFEAHECARDMRYDK